jgi:arabinogalactan endo-1,4-beta-galactosidase
VLLLFISSTTIVLGRKEKNKLVSPKDVSWLPQMEATDIVFYDVDEEKKDCLQLLKNAE